MDVSRRSLLAAAVAPGWTLLPVPDEHVVLAETGGTTRVLLPARTRLRPLQLGTGRLAVLHVAVPEPAMQMLLVVAGGTLGRILLIEPASGQAPDGAHLSTRIDTSGACLLLTRDAAVPREGGRAWERQGWIDRFEWRGDGLADSPVHPPFPGSWQAAMAGRRATIAGSLASMPPETLLRQAACWPWSGPAQPGLAGAG